MAECAVYVSACNYHASDRGHYESELHCAEYSRSLQQPLGCIIPTVGTMTGVFLMRQFFITVPTELMESARIDGANEGSIFVRIMLPICKPQIAILAIFSFQWRWNDYIWPLLALSDPKNTHFSWHSGRCPVRRRSTGRFCFRRQCFP